ncbi:MAG: purine-nucleoside phosphorylase [Bacilli bacterium]|nr:purine-nucleoside phosphorylase [Bacilli bacterium]
MSTHIGANKEDISNLVLICGDPLRSKYIAENYLDDYKLVNEVRGMYGYTGFYKGKRISVMSHGMGIPSAGIYTYELFNEYDVDVMIRLGTAGSYTNELEVSDLLLVTESYSDTVYDDNLEGQNIDTISSNKDLNNIIEETSKKMGILLKKGKVYSSDNFYTKEDIFEEMKTKHRCMAVEMESYVVFLTAKHFNKKSACVLTISDSFVSKKQLTSEEREKKLDDMIRIGLESLSSL